MTMDAYTQYQQLDQERMRDELATHPAADACDRLAASMSRAAAERDWSPQALRSCIDAAVVKLGGRYGRLAVRLLLESRLVDLLSAATPTQRAVPQSEH